MSMFRNASSETLAVLKAAGWTPSRCVAIGEWIRQLASEGYRVHDAAAAVLESVGGLRLTSATRDDRLLCPANIRFDPVFAATGEHDRIAEWEQRYRRHLFPLGEIEQRRIVVCSPDGLLLCGFSASLRFLGNDFASGLNALIAGDRTPPVYQPESG